MNVVPMAPLQQHELRIEITPADLPEDGFTHHVNNARYFAFINRAFQGWYVKMGLRGELPDFTAFMAHCGYDFLRSVGYPGSVLCRLAVVKVGRTSLEHRVEMFDLGQGVSDPDQGAPVLAGVGRVVHVGVSRSTGKPTPWPSEVLEKCWLAPGGPLSSA